MWVLFCCSFALSILCYEFVFGILTILDLLSLLKFELCVLRLSCNIHIREYASNEYFGLALSHNL